MAYQVAGANRHCRFLFIRFGFHKFGCHTLPVAQLFSLGIVTHFMRIQHIIIGAALMAAFVIGCSTSSKETPTVRFGSYIDAVGNAVSVKANQATFEFENPSASLVICAFHQPGGPRDMITGRPRDAFISIQPNRTNHVILRVGQTNAETLSVTVMRVVSSRELSVQEP